jgi:calcium channel MID1
LTATIAVFLLAFDGVSLANAAESRSHGPEVASQPSLGEQAIDDGTGFPVALGSFSGLEVRDNAAEDGELDLFRRKYPTNAKALGNNEVQNVEISVGEVQYYYITKEVVNMQSSYKGKGLPAFINSRGYEESSIPAHQELRKRDTNPIFLSLTTCGKPDSNGTSDPGSFPQLQLWYSLSDSLTEPGPGKNNSNDPIAAVGGYLNTTLYTESDIYLAVSASNSSQWSGKYSYQLAASVDELFHSVQVDNNLLFVDADQSTALLVTNNLTESNKSSTNYQQWMNIKPPFILFAHKTDNTALVGLERSYCALNDLSQVGRISNSTEVGMTSRGLGNFPKEQFYLDGLSSNSIYNGILAMDGNGTKSGTGVVGGGGQVYAAMNFTTKIGSYITQYPRLCLSSCYPNLPRSYSTSASVTKSHTPSRPVQA